MSITDSHRNLSVGSKLRQKFSTSHLQTGSRKQGSVILNAPASMPGLGRELSIMEIGQVNGSHGRHLRIFCEQVCATTKFKTVFVQQNDTVNQCVHNTVQSLNSEGEMGQENCFLCEVIGSLPPNSKAINEFGVVNDPGEIFSELSSRQLLSDENLLGVFALMVPAPGLCRRLELRKKQSTTPLSPNYTSFRTLTRSTENSTSSSNSHSLSNNTTNNSTSQVVAPHGPYLLLLKGSRPGIDLLVYNLSRLHREKSRGVTVGTSELDDIQLYLQPDTKILNENIISNRNGYVNTKSPICLSAMGSHKSNKTGIWISVTSTYNAIEPENPLSVSLNMDTLTTEEKLPVRKCIEPGDMIRIDSKNLTYIFLFKDSNVLPEHKLLLGFLTLSQKSIPNGRPPSGQNANRVANRNSKTEAIVRRTSSSSNQSCESWIVLPRASSVETVISSLFCQNSSKNNEDEDFLPDVAVAAACFAHLVRSIVKQGLDTRDKLYAVRTGEDEVLREINGSLSKELERLTKKASKYLMPAIWKVAFCYYLTQYLTPGWLKNPPAHQPRIRCVERRRSRLGSFKGSSNISDVFVMTPDKSPQGHDLPSGMTESQEADLEGVPVLSALRKKVFVEAESTMNQAVLQSINVISKEIMKICRLFASSSTSLETTEKVQDIQVPLFDKLDWTSEAISRALSNSGHPINSPHQRHIHPPTDDLSPLLRLAQAQPYSTPGERGEKPRRNSDMTDSIEYEATSEATSFTGGPHSPQEEEEEEDVGIGSSITSGCISTAKQRIESVFFCRLIAEFTRRFIEEIINSRTLILNMETGTKVLNLVKALSKWMENAGVLNYKDALKLLHDFAQVLATPRDDLMSMTWQEIHQNRPNLPVQLLYFILSNYEDGAAMRKTGGWGLSKNDIPRENPVTVVADYAKHWKDVEQLITVHRTQGSESAYRPPDLATLFNMESSKTLIESLDNVLAEQGEVFRWSAILKHHPPPSLKTQGITPFPKIEPSFSSSSPGLIRSKHQNNHWPSNANANANSARRQRAASAGIHGVEVEIAEGSARSDAIDRQFKSHYNDTASELSSFAHQGLRRLFPVVGGGFRSLVGNSSPNVSTDNTTLVNWGTLQDVSGARIRNKEFLSQSMDIRNCHDVQSTFDDWSGFTQTIPRSYAQSGDRGPLYRKAQSEVDFSGLPSKFTSKNSNPTSELGTSTLNQSLIGVDVDTPARQTVINLQIEKSSSETFGLVLVEGHLTRLAEMGIYVKSISPNTPASRSDIFIGDRIIAVNGQDLTSMIFKDVCSLLKQSISRVTLTIQRGLVKNPADLLSPSGRDDMRGASSSYD